MSKFREFQAELQKLHEQSERSRRADKGAALRKIKALIAEYHIQPHELGLDELPKPAGVARFADPVSGKTWSGRGRPPQWIVDQDRSRFKIDR